MKIKKLGGRENRYFGFAEIYMNKSKKYYNYLERCFSDDGNFESGFFGNWHNKSKRKKYKMRRDAFYLCPKTTKAFRRILRRMGKDERNIGVTIMINSLLIGGATLFGVIKAHKKTERSAYHRSNRHWILYGEN